jgi:hypothetical protein
VAKRLHNTLFLAAFMVPAFILFRLAVTALYASPETGDFCFSYHYADDGLIGTIWIFYKTAIGRILPMAILTLPAMISRAISLDLFIVYPLLMAAFLLAFVATVAWACSRIWPNASAPEILLLSITLAVTICTNTRSFREMFYWLPGVACYLVPAGIFLIVLTQLLMSAIEGAAMSNRAVASLGILCFAAATCNEFTPIWIMAAIVASFAINQSSQIRQHAILAACTVAGFLVLLAAPGNQIRMSQYPAGGRIWASLDSAFTWFTYDWLLLIQEPSVIAWLAAVASLSIFVMESKPLKVQHAGLISLGTPALFLACSFVTWFIAHYATGEMLALRARNEIEVVIIMCLTFSTLMLAQLAAQFLPPDRPSYVKSAGIILCLALSFNLVNTKVMGLMQSERATFDTFWLESVQRHAAISLSKASDIVVTSRTVRPSLLIQEDLTDNPSRLPNDCVAFFYRKNTVVAH